MSMRQQREIEQLKSDVQELRQQLAELRAEASKRGPGRPPKKQEAPADG